MKTILVKKFEKIDIYLICGIILLLSIVYFLPLWKISMSGPQFPESEKLSLLIMIDKIIGAKEHDLYTINDFNHYVGMDKINSESIKELAVMPFILGYMIFGAFVTLFIQRYFMIVFGLVNFILLGVAGIYDMWSWKYQFAQQMDKTAPLYMEGVDYQVPLIACKDIMNIVSCSWPSWGSYSLTLSAIILIFVLWRGHRMANQYYLK